VVAVVVTVAAEATATRTATATATATETVAAVATTMITSAALSRTKKSYNRNLLYQEMSTRSGSNLVLRVLINFYSYTCNNVY
jgi:hypothetical protein